MDAQGARGRAAVVFASSVIAAAILVTSLLLLLFYQWPLALGVCPSTTLECLNNNREPDAIYLCVVFVRMI